MSQEQLGRTELAIVRLATPIEDFGTLAESFEAMADARQEQLRGSLSFNQSDAGGRTPLDFSIRLRDASTQAVEAATSDARHSTRKTQRRLVREAARAANEALWLLQSVISGAVYDEWLTKGAATIGAPAPVDGCKFHSSAETQVDGFGS